MPVETKVKASTAAAAASGLALWALGHYVFKGGVPDVVASWVYVIIPAALALGAGYWAKHTPRPGDPAAVTAAAVQAFLHGGATPESVTAAVESGDLSKLQPPPAAP